MDGMEIEMAAFGNTFLLDSILKSAVKVSGKDTVDSPRQLLPSHERSLK